MTVHMVRMMVEPPKGDLETPINNLVSNHNEWTADPVEHSLSETNAALDGSGTEYVRGDWRFIQEETADNLLNDLETRLSNIEGGLWHRIGYHECDHDESEPSACSWEQTRENGTVPSDIPEL